MPEPGLKPAALADWLSYLECLHPKSIALGLDRVSLVRDRLQLQPGFPVIIVAGTNGKGSTCAMLEQIYLEAGYRVACYTSPHLLRYNERVRINGQEASDAELCEAFEAVELARDRVQLTYFEFGTLAAVWHFVRCDADIAILEVGLGGRLDAVNIFDPACAIVTNVALDHTEYLGPDRESIGREKAGVYRSAVPAICGDISPPDQVPAQAAAIGADFHQVGRDFDAVLDQGEWRFVNPVRSMAHLPLPALNGAFQLSNAACALEAIVALDDVLPVTRQAIDAGLRNVRLAGRFQLCANRPDIILDVAHNPHAARALAGNLRKNACPGRTLAVFAMLGDKDIAGVINELSAEIDAWFLAGIEYTRGADAATLAGHLSAVTGNEAHCFPDVLSAFRQACLSAGENDRIIVFGSFFTVADVLRELPFIHRSRQEENHG